SLRADRAVPSAAIIRMAAPSSEEWPGSACRSTRLSGSGCRQRHPRELLIVVRFTLGRRHVASRLEQPTRIESVNPGQRGEFDGLEMPPRPLSLNHLVLKRPMIDSARALSYESPRLPTDGSIRASAKRSV